MGLPANPSREPPSSSSQRQPYRLTPRPNAHSSTPANAQHLPGRASPRATDLHPGAAPRGRTKSRSTPKVQSPHPPGVSAPWYSDYERHTRGAADRLAPGPLAASHNPEPNACSAQECQGSGTKVGSSKASCGRLRLYPLLATLFSVGLRSASPEHPTDSSSPAHAAYPSHHRADLRDADSSKCRRPCP